ncbi:hypothetical protein BC835DRAFT_1400182 [Cytidiella melzeri]|nr:hypothetical protein BC835DRAFT_1400182 [Cytidiella melzeri]
MSKRARTEEAEEPREDADVDIVDDIEVEVEMEEEDDGLVDDTRFLPPELRNKKRSTSSNPKARTTTRKAAITKKRAVVWSDEEDEGNYDTAEQDAELQGDDEDFAPEPSSSKRSASSKAYAKTSRPGRGTKSGKGDMEIPTKQASRPGPGMRRGTSAEEEDSKREARGESVSVNDSTPPPAKKPKLPPIKKNKTSAPPNAPPLPAKPPARPTLIKTDLVLPVSGARKSAAPANNADFDLRDASVYASLFAKPSGSTPNAGLVRKEREEERRKELNKMRDEARAKRTQEMKESFDLQASHEKIQRFVEKLFGRRSAAMYPNMLGGAFKDKADRAKVRNSDRPS